MQQNETKNGASGMPLNIVRNDITKMQVDAIVNAANTSLLGGGGVDGCIHRAAGPELLKECRKLGGCPTGEAKITGAGKLPCRYVIHAVGPVWRGGAYGEETLLKSCYRASLELARDYKCESVAFPLISSGIYGYPKDQALQVATDAIGDFLQEHDMSVYIVVFDKASFQIGAERFADIQSYIDDHYAESHTDVRRRLLSESTSAMCPPVQATKAMHRLPGRTKNQSRPEVCEDRVCDLSLEEELEMLDESFTEMLLRKIDERGMTDAACYKKANIDRKLFSKIRKNKDYKPSKPTALAFAVALELSLEETKELLTKAGFALSHSSKFDVIVEYFIRKGVYNIFEINEALFAFDQSLLGAN
jgi:O-acetyl-ADP-ribose deacetylase (regulator of RNase III)